MKALLHFPDSSSAPAGIWWPTLDGEVESYYREPDSWAAKVGASIVLDKPNIECTWEQYFDALANRSTYGSVWETVSTTEDPREVFERFYDETTELLGA